MLKKLAILFVLWCAYSAQPKAQTMEPCSLAGDFAVIAVDARDGGATQATFLNSVHKTLTKASPSSMRMFEVITDNVFNNSKLAGMTRQEIRYLMIDACKSARSSEQTTGKSM